MPTLTLPIRITTIALSVQTKTGQNLLDEMTHHAYFVFDTETTDLDPITMNWWASQ